MTEKGKLSHVTPSAGTHTHIHTLTHREEKRRKEKVMGGHYWTVKIGSIVDQHPGPAAVSLGPWDPGTPGTLEPWNDANAEAESSLNDRLLSYGSERKATASKRN